MTFKIIKYAELALVTHFFFNLANGVDYKPGSYSELIFLDISVSSMSMHSYNNTNNPQSLNLIIYINSPQGSYRSDSQMFTIEILLTIKKGIFFCIILQLFASPLHTDTPKQICKLLQLGCLQHRLHETRPAGVSSLMAIWESRERRVSLGCQGWSKHGKVKKKKRWAIRSLRHN